MKMFAVEQYYACEIAVIMYLKRCPFENWPGSSLKERAKIGQVSTVKSRVISLRDPV